MDRIRSLLSELPDERWLRVAIVVVVSLLAAKLVQWLITGVVRRLARRTKSDVDDRIVAALLTPVFWSVVMLGLGTVVLIVEPPEIVATISLRVLQTFAIVLWAVASVRIALAVLDGLAALKERPDILEDATLDLFANLSRVCVFAGALYWGLVTWDINVAPIIASAGIVGIAIGFAAKDTLANLFAGVFILTDKPYRPGDFINLDTGQRGQVTAIGLRSTRLLTRDDVEVTVPNSVIGQATIVNESGGPEIHTRIRLAVGVAYGSDIDRVIEILERIPAEHANVCDDPSPRARFRAFGDSSLDFELLCWVPDPALRGLVLHELHCSVYKEFQAAGVQIPFPQRDVHFVSPPPAEPGPSDPAP